MMPRGLTLIEMLISLFIFSLIALGSYRVLTASLQLDERLQHSADELLAAGAGMQQFRADIEHIRYRQIGDNQYPQLDADGRLRFIRTASGYGDGRVGVGLLALQYSLAERNSQRIVLREVWNTPSFDGEPHSSAAVLIGIDRLVIELIDEGQRYRRWPPTGGQGDEPLRPEAISVNWLSAGAGDNQMLLLLP